MSNKTRQQRKFWNSLYVMELFYVNNELTFTSTHCTRGCMGPRAGLDIVVNFFASVCYQTPIFQPVTSHYTDWTISTSLLTLLYLETPRFHFWEVAYQCTCPHGDKTSTFFYPQMGFLCLITPVFPWRGLFFFCFQSLNWNWKVVNLTVIDIKNNLTSELNTITEEKFSMSCGDCFDGSH
jgi:hypothetical protein